MISRSRPPQRPVPPASLRVVWPAWVEMPAPEMGLSEVQRNRDLSGSLP